MSPHQGGFELRPTGTKQCNSKEICSDHSLFRREDVSPGGRGETRLTVT